MLRKRHLYNFARPFRLRPSITSVAASQLSQVRRVTSFSTNSFLTTVFHRSKWDKPAIVHSPSGTAFSYGQLLRDAAVTARNILNRSEDNVDGKRIAFVARNDYNYVVTLLAIIAARGVAVPIAPSLPVPEIQYILEQSQASSVYTIPDCRPKIIQSLPSHAKNVPVHDVDHRKATAVTSSPDSVDSMLLGHSSTTTIDSTKQNHSPAMVLYTSGTTSRPKGVILSDINLLSQARSLMEAWEYSHSDRILHCLPLNHIHGIMNGLLSPLLAGSTIEFQFPFSAEAIWKRLARPFKQDGQLSDKISIFTAVPTIYKRLIDSLELLDAEDRQAVDKAISPEHLRLNMSGSASLPIPLKSAWRDISRDNILLERYGMTETGMILSCGLNPTQRVDGSVGWPLPNVEVRLVHNEGDANSGEAIPADVQEAEGLIQVKGLTVFKGYLNNPSATDAAFTKDENGNHEWFNTGDVATRKMVQGASPNGKNDWANGPMYFIKGRNNVDIIKRGGEKIGALEIEDQLLKLSYISEAVVFGVPSTSLGEKVAGVIVLDSANLPDDLTKLPIRDVHRSARLRIYAYLRSNLAAPKIPHAIKFVEELPRNHMGKVNKHAIARKLFPSEDWQS